MRLGVILLSASLQAAIVVQTPNGTTISADPGGAWSVTFANSAFQFGGSTGVPLANLASVGDTDAIGPYVEISFDYTLDAPRHASIRAYQNRQAVLFSIQFPAGTANVAPFPTFTTYPSLPYHLTYSGIFAGPSFPGFSNEGPWLFFDSTASAFLLSPAANFLTAATTRGHAGEISTGIDSQIAALPPGFAHSTLLVAESGINRAFDTWGRSLTDLSGKLRPANDSAPILNQLGYWTDNGATYYYHSDPNMSYADTLTAVNAEFAQKGIALGYVQLDSWFYPKGSQADWSDGNDGIYEYSAAPALFPAGLAAFQQTLGLPLVTHARWIDATSPIRRQYQVSGNVVTDPSYWNSTADYLTAAGVITYEQDWLGASAHTDFNLTDPYAFLDNMASAMSTRGLTMQYCMGTPNDFLQSTRYNNLTNFRTSGDRFDRPNWDPFLYASRLASAVGIWPFSDNFQSSEADNLLLATLSAGPLGVGDALGTVSAGNLLQAVRPDGVIVKPDAPIVPLDQSYIAGAQSQNTPMLASTYTDFGGGLRAAYVFAYTRGSNTVATFRPADAGIDGPVYIYDYFAGAGTLANSTDLYTTTLTNGRGYHVLTPIGPSGIAMLGDLGQFVTLGKKRIAALSDDGAVHVTVAFAPGETVRTIAGYAPSAPTASTGIVNYDPITQRFTIDVVPGVAQTASVDIAPGE